MCVRLWVLLPLVALNSCGGGGYTGSMSGSPALTAIAVSPNPVTSAVGISQQLSAKGTYSDGSSADLTSSVTWGVGSSTVATVTAGGVITGAQTGTTMVSATMDMVSGSTSLTVVASGTWQPGGKLLSARTRQTAILLSTGQVLILGGTAGHMPYAEQYDPATQMSQALANPASLPEGGGESLTSLGNGPILKAGGDQPAGYLATVELYNPTTNAWTPASNLATARARHTATLLNDGKVLVAGGLNASGPLATAELYDPVANTWAAAGTLAAARYDHTATLLTDGRVLVVGGSSNTSIMVGTDPTDVTPTAELYDPSTNTWSSAGAMANPRALHSATLLQGGTVLIAGGDALLKAGAIVGTPDAELYDPMSNSWSVSGAFADNGTRIEHTATLLPGGMVLVAGGDVTIDTQSSTTAELFDTTTGTWSTTGSLTVPRAFHSATLLPNSVVLACGGDGTGAAPSSCEEYF